MGGQDRRGHLENVAHFCRASWHRIFAKYRWKLGAKRMQIVNRAARITCALGPITSRACNMKKTRSPTRAKLRTNKFTDTERAQIAAALTEALVTARPAIEKQVREYEEWVRKIASEVTRTIHTFVAANADRIRETLNTIANPVFSERGLQFVNQLAAWESEATALFAAFNEGSFSDFEAYVRDRPPSAGTIGFLVLVAQDKLMSDKQRGRATHPRKRSLVHQIRVAGVTRYSELKSKAPHLLKDGKYSKEQLTQAISKAKSSKKKFP